MRTPYQSYDVLAKWDSVSFDDITRRVLARRLQNVPQRRYLSEHEWRTMDAIAARLMPQPDRVSPIPITPWIDEELALDRREGFRFDGMPPLRDAWRAGLAGVDAEARRRHGETFAGCDAAAQDGTLRAI